MKRRGERRKGERGSETSCLASRTETRLGMSTTARYRACSASSGSSNWVRVMSPNVEPRLSSVATALSRRREGDRVLERGTRGTDT